MHVRAYAPSHNFHYSHIRNEQRPVHNAHVWTGTRSAYSNAISTRCSMQPEPSCPPSVRRGSQGLKERLWKNKQGHYQLCVTRSLNLSLSDWLLFVTRSHMLPENAARNPTLNSTALLTCERRRCCLKGRYHTLTLAGFNGWKIILSCRITWYVTTEDSAVGMSAERNSIISITLSNKPYMSNVYIHPW